MTRHFRSGVFCGGGDFQLFRSFDFQDLVHAQEPENSEGEQNKKRKGITDLL